MNPIRRSLLSTTVLACAVAACTTVTNPNGTTSVQIDPGVQSAFNGIQFVLPLLDVLGAGIALAVPAAAPLIAAATPYLNAAGTVFQTLQVTMTQTQAQPIVKQIEGYVSGVITAAQNVISANPSLASLMPKLQQAQAVLGLLTAFVNGVVAGPVNVTAAMRMPALLHK